MMHWRPWRRRESPKIMMREKLFEQDEQRTAFYERLIQAAKSGQRLQ